MRFQDYTVKAWDKDGNEKEVTGQVAIPETLKELLTVYPEKRVYKLGLDEYIRKAKRRLVSTHSRRLVLRLRDLTIEQQAALRKAGLLKNG